MKEAKEFNSSTGELTGNITITLSPEEYQRIMHPNKKKKQDYEVYISKEMLKEWVRNQGNYFYFLVYKNLMEDFPDDTALLFRFMYICTYGDYNNVLTYNRRDMMVSECKDLFGLSEKPNREIYNSLVDNGLLIIDGKKIKINPKYYIRGTIQDYDTPFTRVFNQGVRDLYTKANYREHKALGHFVPLLPYVNKYTNIVCHNPEESNINNLMPLNLSQVADLFEVNQSNSNRLKHSLLDITVNNVPILGYFTREFNHEMLKCFIVNPYVFYKAPRINDLESISRLFAIPAN